MQQATIQIVRPASPAQEFAAPQRWQVSQVEALFALPFNELIYKAQTVHRAHFDPAEVQLSTLLSIKTGGCAETCSYCPQSAAYDTGVEATALMKVDEVLDAARAAQAAGATRFCMGAAWRGPKDRDIEKVSALISAVKGLGLETCATLGMLGDGHAETLRDAGLDYYNHNIDTAPDKYADIVQTRQFEDRLDTLQRDRFTQMTRRDELHRVLDGIEAAKEAGFNPVKINAVIERGVNDDEIVALAEFGRDNDVEVRFIEFMPLDASGHWMNDKVVSQDDIVAAISAVHPLELVPARGAAPADRWEAYGLLEDRAATSLEKLEIIGKLRALAKELGANDGMLDVAELRVLLSRADEPGIMRLLNHLQREHARDQKVIAALAEVLGEAGVDLAALAAQAAAAGQMPGGPAGPPIGGGQPVASDSGRIWTPGGAQAGPAGEKKSIWTPD